MKTNASIGNEINISRKVLLATLGIAALAAPVVCILAQPQTATTPSLTYDVASIKLEPPSDPNHINIRVSYDADTFIATGVTVKGLIALAYNVRDFQVSGGPGWSDSEKYAVSAKIDEQTLETIKKLTPDQGSEQRRLMLQSLLTERFKLKLSHSSKELPTYALVVMKSGPRFSESNGPHDAPTFSQSNGQAKVKGGSMTGFAEWLSRFVGRKVVDKTGLKGSYDFTFHWTNERLPPTPASAADSAPRPATLPSDSGPSIFTALQEQLGLKLESQKGPVEILVIDSVEKPSEN